MPLFSSLFGKGLMPTQYRLRQVPSVHVLKLNARFTMMIYTYPQFSRVGDVHASARAVSLKSLSRAVQPQSVLRPGFDSC